MSSEPQGLQLLVGSNLLPDDLLNDSNSYLSIISYLQGTSPSWLVNSIIENTLRGTATVVNSDLLTIVPNRKRVVLASFMNTGDFYVSGTKKNGLNLDREANYQFVDCFTDLFSNLIKNPTNALAECSTIFDSIKAKIHSHDTVVILEGIDILLSGTDINPNELLQHLFQINKKCCQLFVVFPHDMPQVINPTAMNPNDPAYKSAEFLFKLHHRSSMNILVQPLPTGRASDLTGSLSISKGPVPYTCTSVLEREYTFNVLKDSTVKLYYR